MNSWWYFIPFIFIPILVHLFDFRRAKKLYFSSVRYLTNLTSKTKSKSKLRYFLILTNRILIFATLIGLLIILLGHSKNPLSQGGFILAYYDNSISSTINDSDNNVKLGLDQLTKSGASILYLNNSEDYIIDKNSEFKISSNKSSSSLNLQSLSEKFDEINASSHYFFSDLQSIEIPNLISTFIDSSKNYHLIITNNLNEIGNVSIDSLYLIPNQENFSELSIIVDFNVSNMKTGNVVIKLMSDDRQMSSIVKDVTELDDVRFDVSKDLEGEFEITIDGDDVLFDNSFNFTLSKRFKPRITIIASEVSEIFEEVYKNEELFDVIHQDVDNLDYDALASSDLVIISNQYKLQKSLANQLSDVNFLIFTADSVDEVSYEQFLNLNIELLNTDTRSEINIDAKHPLMRGVFERSVKIGSMPSEQAIFKFSGDYEPIIDFRGGIPFLLKKDNSYFFNTSLNSISGGFQSNALFLPILYQIAFSTSGSVEIPFYYPGNRIALSTKVSDVPVKLIREDFEVIPVFNSLGSQTIIELPNDLNAGKYQLVQANDTLQDIAINVRKSESIMRAPTIENVRKAFFESKNVTISEFSEDESNIIMSGGPQSSLWKYALILALLLILTETVLHRYLR